MFDPTFNPANPIEEGVIYTANGPIGILEDTGKQAISDTDRAIVVYNAPVTHPGFHFSLTGTELVVEEFYAAFGVPDGASFIESKNHVPFDIQRVHWIYDVPGGETRGGHAYKTNQEFIIALSGSFAIAIDNGKEKKIYTLNRSYYGLYIPAGIWRTLENFSTNSLALVISSTPFSIDDYIYDFECFKSLKSNE